MKEAPFLNEKVDPVTEAERIVENYISHQKSVRAEWEKEAPKHTWKALLGGSGILAVTALLVLAILRLSGA